MVRRLVLLTVVFAGCASADTPAPAPPGEPADPRSTAAPTEAQCDAFVAHVIEVQWGPSPDDATATDDVSADIRRDCLEAGTVAEVECALAQSSMDEIQRLCL